MRMFERKSMNKSAHDLAKMNENGKLSFDNVAQRSLVWKNTIKDNRKSLLIHSMIIGYPIPPMYCNCVINPDNVRDRTYDFIDGKQRTNTVCEFLNDEFELINVPIVNIDETAESDEDTDDENLLNLNGMRFSDLPDEIRRKVENYQFTIYYYENLTDEEFREMMFRLNNGKGLTSAEKSRINTEEQAIIMEMARHRIFEKALSANALKGFKNEVIVKQTWGILNVPNVSFKSKDFNPIIETAHFTDEQQKEIMDIYDRIYNCHEKLLERAKSETDSKKQKLINKVAKRILGRTHISSISPAIKDSIERQLSEDDVCNWMQHFFGSTKTTTISKPYNDSALTGSAEARKIHTRVTEVMNDYKQFFGIVDVNDKTADTDSETINVNNKTIKTSDESIEVDSETTNVDSENIDVDSVNQESVEYENLSL